MMLILTFGPQSGFEDDFGQSDTKNHYFMSFAGQMTLRNSITMAMPKVPGDQKLYVNTKISKV